MPICPTCHGKLNLPQSPLAVCPTCRGTTGLIPGRPRCSECGGTGKRQAVYNNEAFLVNCTFCHGL